MNNTPEKRFPPPRGLFIQMSGAPGSGKSTTAKKLAELIDGVAIDHDVIKSSLLEDISFEQATKAAYRLDWALAEAFIQQGRSVIIDSTCNYQVILDQGAALAQRYGYDYWYIECKVNNIALLDERLHKRVPLRSQRIGVDLPPTDASSRVPDKDSRALFKRWIEHPCRPDHNVILVDATSNLENCLGYIMTQISSATGAQASILPQE